MLGVAIAAIHGAVSGRLERNFTFFFAIGADRFEHFFGSAVSSVTASIVLILHYDIL
jgi:hypothetical protein